MPGVGVANDREDDRSRGDNFIVWARGWVPM